MNEIGYTPTLEEGKYGSIRPAVGTVSPTINHSSHPAVVSRDGY